LQCRAELGGVDRRLRHSGGTLVTGPERAGLWSGVVCGHYTKRCLFLHREVCEMECSPPPVQHAVRRAERPGRCSAPQEIVKICHAKEPWHSPGHRESIRRDRFIAIIITRVLALSAKRRIASGQRSSADAMPFRLAHERCHDLGSDRRLWSVAGASPAWLDTKRGAP
jgi:hypothetical protein